MITKSDEELILKADDMLDWLCYKPYKYTISGDKLYEELEKLGILENYRRWDEYLKKEGFKFTHPTAENMKNGLLIYYYDTDLAVKGDHSYDGVRIWAYLTAEKVLFLYDSSNINYYIYDEPDELKKIERFMERYHDFINFNPPTQTIEMRAIGSNVYFLCEKTEDHYIRISDFARLATMLDMEMNKKHPFSTVREFEQSEQAALIKTMTEEPYYRMAFRKYSDECILETAIGCSYSKSKNDALLRLGGLLDSLIPENERLREPLTIAYKTLKEMEYDEFIRLQDEVFDI